METKLFVCITYIVACHIFAPKKENSILHKHPQNKHLFIFAFLFVPFYFHTIRRLCFPKNISKVIEGFK